MIKFNTQINTDHSRKQYKALNNYTKMLNMSIIVSAVGENRIDRKSITFDSKPIWMHILMHKYRFFFKKKIMKTEVVSKCTHPSVLRPKYHTPISITPIRQSSSNAKIETNQ